MPDLSFSVVEPPRVQPPRVSLLASAEEVPAGDSRWVAGIGFDPISCGTSGGYFLDRCESDSESNDFDDKPVEPSSRLVEYRPYVAYYGDSCSTATFRSRDFPGRATAAYVAAESALMATELWTGAVSTAGGLGNFHLASSDADVLPGVWPVGLGLARLQFELGEVIPSRGMIHAPRDIVSVWVELGFVRREGAVLVDAYDNVVVADTGYPGTAPNGDPRTTTGAFVYATDMVQVRRDGQIRLLPTVDEAMAGAAMDRDINLIEWRAERTVAAYTAECAHIAIAVDLCVVDCPEGS